MFSVANRTTRAETKIKQQTENKTNKNSVANDETNYAMNRKVSEVFNKISTNTQPVTGVLFLAKAKKIYMFVCFRFQAEKKN